MASQPLETIPEEPTPAPTPPNSPTPARVTADPPTNQARQEPRARGEWQEACRTQPPGQGGQEPGKGRGCQPCASHSQCPVHSQWQQRPLPRDCAWNWRADCFHVGCVLPARGDHGKAQTCPTSTACTACTTSTTSIVSHSSKTRNQRNGVSLKTPYILPP